MVFSYWSAIPSILAITTSLGSSHLVTTPSISDIAAPHATIGSLPPEASSVMRWYRQTVYDRTGQRVGEIDDLLVDRTGKVVALIIGIGPQGMSTKHVALNFNDVRAIMIGNDDIRLTTAASAESLADAPGYDYNSIFMSWSPSHPSPTTGESSRR